MPVGGESHYVARAKILNYTLRGGDTLRHAAEAGGGGIMYHDGDWLQLVQG